MTHTRKTQIGLVAVAVVLFVLLFLAPKKKSSLSEEQETQDHANEKVIVPEANLESFLTLAVNVLKTEDKTNYQSLVTKANTSTIDSAFITLVQFWDKLKRPDLASFFIEKIADRKHTSQAYVKAGDRYYYAVRFTKDNSEIPVLYQSAIRSYQKALDIDQTNSDAKIQLAACYVEGSADPMKGIALLREVEKVDSNNVKLQLTFAFFSVKSGQLDKAIIRFENVLRIDPLYIEAYLHLADAYEQMGNKSKTIEMLEKYASTTEDMMAKQEVLKYIEQLKK